MKHHSITYMTFLYPVGSRIGVNESVFSSMCEQFINIANPDILSHKKVYLICSGSSGAIISTIMYFHLMNSYVHLNNKVSIIHIKKQDEESHASICDGLPFNYDSDSLYIWVDDHINNGNTIMHCYEKCNDRITMSGDIFLFDWAVCLTSEKSRCMKSQLEFFTQYTKNMVCNIDNYCQGGPGGMGI